VNELALFAGAGGGILGGKLLGWRTVCAVELDGYARRVLCARQDDGCLPPFPIWDDVRTFDGKPWRGLVDVVSGGFPCQDISVAGGGAGLDGEQSGLWREMRRIVGEIRPQNVYVENSPALTVRGLGVVLGDLAALGYDARWGVLGACDAGAPHKRERIWIVAHAHFQRLEPCRTKGGRNDADIRIGNERARHLQASALTSGGEDMADTNSAGREEQRRTKPNGAEHETAERGDWWAAEPGMGRMANGLANRVDRLRALGNGQVPAVAALAWNTLRRNSGC